MRFNPYLDAQRGDCAWLSCDNRNCAVMRDQRGKLITLPGCLKHKEWLTKIHQQYKKIGEFYINTPMQRLSKDKQFKVLQANAAFLMAEIERRLEFTKGIKQIYRDRGHELYITSLMTQAELVLKAIGDFSEDDEDCKSSEVEENCDTSRGSEEVCNEPKDVENHILSETEKNRDHLDNNID